MWLQSLIKKNMLLSLLEGPTKQLLIPKPYVGPDTAMLVDVGVMLGWEGPVSLHSFAVSVGGCWS